MWHCAGNCMIHWLWPLHLPYRPLPFELRVTDCYSIYLSLMYTTTKGENTHLLLGRVSVDFHQEGKNTSLTLKCQLSTSKQRTART